MEKTKQELLNSFLEQTIVEGMPREDEILTIRSGEYLVEHYPSETYEEVGSTWYVEDDIQKASYTFRVNKDLQVIFHYNLKTLELLDVKEFRE